MNIRAYIAASRRSDRSLEARVESARHASEIHKRRTGRSLRVTESEVNSERVYEEEIDDRASQFQNLAASQCLGSAGFDSRVEAYLTNQLAMRNAIDQLNTVNVPQRSSVSGINKIDTFQPSTLGCETLRSPTYGYRPAPYHNPYQAGLAHMYGSAYTNTIPMAVSDIPMVRNTSHTSRTGSFQQGGRSTSTDKSQSQVPFNNVRYDEESGRELQRQVAGTSNNKFTPMCCLNAASSGELHTHARPGLLPTAPTRSMAGISLEDYLSSPNYSWSSVPGSMVSGQSMSGFETTYNSSSASMSPATINGSTRVASASPSTGGPLPGGRMRATDAVDARLGHGGANLNGFDRVPATDTKFENGTSEQVAVREESDGNFWDFIDDGAEGLMDGKFDTSTC